MPSAQQPAPAAKPQQAAPDRAAAEVHRGADPGAVIGAEAGAGAADAALDRLVDQVRAAQADGAALCLRGTGSKDFYGGPARGAPLDTRALRGICSYEPTEMVITARAGTPLAELEATLAEHGQCLAFEPPRYGGGGTVGGMVAAGLSGPARASAGSVRDFLLGAVLLNGRAQLLRFGGQVMKNVAGYDVARVLPGSLGILGVICEVSLKVLPVAPARTTLVFTCTQAQAIEHVHRWSATALPISASAWRGGRLQVRLAGAHAAVGAATARLRAQFDGAPLDEPAAAALWAGLRDQADEFFTGAAAGEQRLWRLSLPSSHPPLELPGDVLIEWGGAQRWLLSDAPADLIQARASRAGGHAAIFRARERPSDFLAPLPDKLVAIHKSLKRAFDPQGIFNPGRLYSWL
jgi:glycolate oxidase FAD binding subunit